MANPDHDAVLGVIAYKAQKPLDLAPGSTALLVIDVQHSFMQPDGRFAKLSDALAPAAGQYYRQRVAAPVLPNVERLVSSFRKSGLPVFFTGVGTRTGDDQDLPGWLREFNDISRGAIGDVVFPAVDEADWRIHDIVKPLSGESVLQKTTADPFVSTDLEELLHDRGVRTVVVCGVLTDACVSATARGAADRDFNTIVVEDGCATVSEALHRAALEIIGLSFGRIVTSDDIVDALERVEPVAPELVPPSA